MGERGWTFSHSSSVSMGTALSPCHPRGPLLPAAPRPKPASALQTWPCSGALSPGVWEASAGYLTPTPPATLPTSIPTSRPPKLPGDRDAYSWIWSVALGSGGRGLSSHSVLHTLAVRQGGWPDLGHRQS